MFPASVTGEGVIWLFLHSEEASLAEGKGLGFSLQQPGKGHGCRGLLAPHPSQPPLAVTLQPPVKRISPLPPPHLLSLLLSLPPPPIVAVSCQKGCRAAADASSTLHAFITKLVPPLLLNIISFSLLGEEASKLRLDASLLHAEEPEEAAWTVTSSPLYFGTGTGLGCRSILSGGLSS